MVKVHRYVILGVGAILLLSLIANFFFYMSNPKANGELNKSKGRVEVLTEMTADLTIKMDSLNEIIRKDTVRINKTTVSIKEKIKIIYYEKNRISNLPLDSALCLFAGRYSK